jgi:hypothetical protein
MVVGMERSIVVFWKPVKGRVFPIVAILLALVAGAPVPDPVCRIKCEAAVLERAAAAPDRFCHAASPEKDSQSPASRHCSRRTRACALSAAADPWGLPQGLSSRELPAVLAGAGHTLSREEPGADFARPPRPFASPPSGVFSSVLRL